MIYQELSLARPISITENLLAGRLPRRGHFLDKGRARKQASALLARVGLDLDPNLPIEDISQHEAQLVEIAKVLGNSPCILVMDEPTSALSREEVERLFEIIGQLKSRGIAIVYISHHLPEIFRIADRVTVMRDGKKIATKPIAEVSREEVVQMMVGRSVKEFYKRDERKIGETRFEVRGLSRFGFFHDVSFEARRGEIRRASAASPGPGGASSPRSSPASIAPTRDRSTSTDRPVRGRNMAERPRPGHRLPHRGPQDTRAWLCRLSVGRKRPSRRSSTDFPEPESTLRSRGVADRGRASIEELAIYPPDPERTVGNLSGGNQQKVLLAKWLASEPKVLILDEPTRGVDIGAKMTIHASIEKLAREGCTVLLISSDLPELVGLSDRVMIMHKGHFTREMACGECSEESLLLAANGDVPSGEGHNEGRA